MIRLAVYILGFTVTCAAAIEGQWAWVIVLAAVTYTLLPPKETT